MISSLSLTAHEAHNTAVEASRRSNEAEALITSRIEHELQAVREIAEGRPQDSGQEIHSVPGSAIGTMIYKNKEMIDTVRSSTASSFQYYDKRIKDVETHCKERINRVDDDVGKLHTKIRSMSAATESHTHALEGHRAALKLSRSDTGWRSLSGKPSTTQSRQDSHGPFMPQEIRAYSIQPGYSGKGSKVKSLESINMTREYTFRICNGAWCSGGWQRCRGQEIGATPIRTQRIIEVQELYFSLILIWSGRLRRAL